MLQAVLDKLLPSTTLHDPNPISPFVFFDAPLASSSSRAALASLGVLVNTTLASNIDEIVRRQSTWALLTGDESLWRIQPDQVRNHAEKELFARRTPAMIAPRTYYGAYFLRVTGESKSLFTERGRCCELQVFSLARSAAFQAASINDHWRRVLVNIVMMTLPRGIPLIYAGEFFHTTIRRTR